jgi:MFS family permease
MSPYQNTTINPRTFLKTMSIIHAALIAGQVLFAFAVIALNNNRAPFSFSFNSKDVFAIVVPIMVIGCFIAGRIVFTKVLENAKTKSTLIEKLSAYWAASIVRFALCEGSSLFAIVVTMLTSNTFYLAIAGVLILYMVFLKPSRDRVENDLDLTLEERLELSS